MLLVESRRVFARKAFHRQKAHLVLSAMRHRAAELGERCRYARVDRYRDALGGSTDRSRCSNRRRGPPWPSCEPLAAEREVERLPARGYVTTREDFTAWAESRGRRRLLLEDFYRDARRRHGVLMDGDEPVGGRWNLDAENREPPPRGQDDPRCPGTVVAATRTTSTAEVRDDLDRWARDGDVTFLGADGPRRFAATRAEAVAALDDFVTNRLPRFGPRRTP